MKLLPVIIILAMIFSGCGSQSESRMTDESGVSETVLQESGPVSHMSSAEELPPDSQESAEASQESDMGRLGPNPQKPTDLVRRVFITESNSDYTIYSVVIYERRSKELLQMSYEIRYKRDLGYSAESLQSVEVDSIFPNVSSMGFATVDILDDGNRDYVTLRVSFNNLDRPENFNVMIDNGILRLKDDGVEEFDYLDGASICRGLLDHGASELEIIDYLCESIDVTLYYDPY